MQEIIHALKLAPQKEVIVVGDIMLDEYVIGAVDRISPEAPVPVIREETREHTLGGAANVAFNVARAGCNVQLIGMVGAGDRDGKKIIEMLQEKGISTSGIVFSLHRSTIKKKRIVSQQQQLLRIDTEDTFALTEQERLAVLEQLRAAIKPGRLVVLSDYAKGLIDKQLVHDVVSMAKSCGVLVVVDPKGPHFDKYVGVSYLKPNLKEFNQMVQFFGLSQSNPMVENGRHICSMLGLNGLVVTLGEKGLQLITPTRTAFFQAHKQEVFDITGAGDTVLAFLSVGLVQGYSIDQSLELANKAASIAVAHNKTYAVSLDDLGDANQLSGGKVVQDWQALKNIIASERQCHKKKIVFTNGCFDLLHSGHIFVLQEAKKRGDILVVALNTDASIKRFKGASRPIQPLEERVVVMAALEMVDFVTIFDQDTPYELIKFLVPDVLVKGGDYKPEQIAGHDVVIAAGGSVEVVDYKKGRSTSNLIATACRANQLQTASN